MKKKVFVRSHSPLTLLFAFTALLLIALLPKHLKAQNLRPFKSEKATCEIKVSSKEVVSSTSKLKGRLKREIAIQQSILKAINLT